MLLLSVNSAVTILKSESKITIFCPNQPRLKSRSLLSHWLIVMIIFAAITGCYWIKWL